MVSCWSNTSLRGIEAPRPAVTKHNPKPTVSLGVTSAVVCTYGYDDGRILPTRCAIIDAGLDGRCRRRRTRRTPPAAARSVRNALAAGLRLVSTADPGAFPRSRTTPPGGIRPSPSKVWMFSVTLCLPKGDGDALEEGRGWRFRWVKCSSCL